MFKISYVIFEHGRNILFSFRMQVLYFFIVLLQLALHLFVDSGWSTAASKAFCILDDMLDFMDESFFYLFVWPHAFQSLFQMPCKQSFFFFQRVSFFFIIRQDERAIFRKEVNLFSISKKAVRQILSYGPDFFLAGKFFFMHDALESIYGFFYPCLAF